MRAFLAGLVIAILAVGAAGIYLLRPMGGGMQFSYQVAFPPGFSGDRKAVARETADVLQNRVTQRCISSGATPHVDGRVLLRLANVTEEQLPEIRAILERRGDLRVYERLEGVPSSGKAILLWEDVLVATADPPEGGARTITLQLTPEAARMMIRVSQSGATLAVYLDDLLVSTPRALPPNASGEIFVPMDLSEPEARIWGTVLQGGRLPYPLGAAQVEPYRGNSLRP